MSERIYATKHIEIRLQSLHKRICEAPSYPKDLLDEYDRLLTNLGRIKLAERMGIQPDTLLSDTRRR